MGYYNPSSGVYFYDTSDIIGNPDTVVLTLNRAQQALHDAIIALKDRVALTEARQNAADIQVIQPNAFVTLSTGWRWRQDRTSTIRRIGGRIEVSLFFEKTSGDISHGDVAAQIRSEWSPIQGTEWLMNAFQHDANGSSTSPVGGVIGASNRAFTVLSPTTARRMFSCTGFYHRV